MKFKSFIYMMKQNLKNLNSDVDHWMDEFIINYGCLAVVAFIALVGLIAILLILFLGGEQ